MLELQDVSVAYKGNLAVHNLSLEVPRGSAVAIVGANGAGKTSALRSISGLVRPSAGKILWKGRDITGIAPSAIVGMGIAHVPEGRRLFSHLTVKENLLMGALTLKEKGHQNQYLREVYERFPILQQRQQQKAGTLSGGEQQMLAIARALGNRPELILFDEPSLGLSPVMVEHMFEIIREIHAQGTTVLLVEQNAVEALELTDFAYVLQNGECVLKGPSLELRDSTWVKQAYLGM